MTEPTAEPASDPVDPVVRRYRLLVAVLGALLLAALVTVGILWQARSDDRARDDARRAAISAAEKAAVAMTSYDYSTAEDDFGWVDDAGTESFREHYAEVSEPVERLVVNLKAHAEGEVLESAARVHDPDHVTVLLFVDQEITNEGADKPTVDQPRVLMEMVRQDGRWLVDEVEIRNLTGAGQG